jgi:hypothetical protein
VHHESASQLSWLVSPAEGALCERCALLGDTIKSTPQFKAAVGMKFKVSTHIARVTDSCSHPNLHRTASASESRIVSVRSARYVVAVCTSCDQQFVKSFAFFQNRTYFTGFVFVDDHKQLV